MAEDNSIWEELEARLPSRWADVIERPRLTPRERYLGSILACVVTGQPGALAFLFEQSYGADLKASEVHEILLQSVLFAGYPRTLSAFDVLSKVAGDDASESLDIEAGVDPSTWLSRGRRLFESIYGQAADPVLERLAAHHPALPDWILRDAYGRVLSRTGLSPQDRELAAVAALTASRLPEQLYSHARGALRLGAPPEAVSEMIFQMSVHVPPEWIREARATCAKLLTSPK